MKTRFVLLSSFDVRNLAGALRATGGDDCDVKTGSFGQVAQHVLERKDPLWSPQADVAVVWTTPEAVSDAFRAILEGRRWQAADLDREVEAHVALVARLVGRVGGVLLPTWTVDPTARGRGLATARAGSGVHRALARMNLRLMEAAEGVTGLFVIPAEPWISSAGRGAYSPKHWFMAKWPFSMEVAKLAAVDLLAAAAALKGAAKKLVVVDLDDTLWGGILGEDGVEGIVLGGHDPRGEAFVEFQRALAALRETGVLLAVASKNDETLAREAMSRHAEMILRERAFATWRIDWNDKASNIAAIADELSLGLDSVVFIDDNPAERDRVRQALPAVTVPDWPSDVMLFPQTLRSLSCFDTPAISEEDRVKTEQYVAERARRSALTEIGTVEDWVESLGVKVMVSALDARSLARAAQLLNKTNQMNLATRRMSAAELAAWAHAERQRVLTVRATDRLGDYGMVGLLGLREADEELEIVDFVLSCRAMGRGVEEAMIRAARQVGGTLGKGRVVARYQRTDRNTPCLAKLRALGCAEGPDGEWFSWSPQPDGPRFGGVELAFTEAETGEST